MLDLSDSAVHALDPQRLTALRDRAASRLIGPAGTKDAGARAVDALSVLHALASSPETASKALTLLHELQVYQVELDLQAQELQDSRVELESALRRQIELYDYQPVGCFTVDARLLLLELNQTGAGMLGIERDEACGLSLGAFFSTDSERRFIAALSNMDADTQRTSCRLELSSKVGPDRPVLVSIGKDPTVSRYLVSLALLS